MELKQRYVKMLMNVLIEEKAGLNTVSVVFVLPLKSVDNAWNMDNMIFFIRMRPLCPFDWRLL